MQLRRYKLKQLVELRHGHSIDLVEQVRLISSKPGMNGEEKAGQVSLLSSLERLVAIPSSTLKTALTFYDLKTCSRSRDSQFGELLYQAMRNHF